MIFTLVKFLSFWNPVNVSLNGKFHYYENNYIILTNLGR